MIQLGFKFDPKLQLDFYVICLESSSTCFLHVVSLYFIFEFLLWKKESKFGE